MEVPVPRILLLLALFFTAPLWAATLPGVPAATTDQSSSSEPDLAQKKAAYGALADVLENADARQELIDQLRKAAATPPPDSTPTLTPPEIKDETTVLENVTHISREYGEQLSSRFSQLWRNITGSPHKAFNSQTFTSAAAFPAAGRSGICVLVAGTPGGPAAVSQDGSLGTA